MFTNSRAVISEVGKSLKARSAALLAEDELRQIGNAAQILRHRLRLGDLDAEMRFEELDQLKDAGGIDDSALDEGFLRLRSLCRVAEKIVVDDKVQKFRSNPGFHVHPTPNP